MATEAIIRDLAAKLSDARRWYDACGRRNVWGLNDDQRRQSAADFAVAAAEVSRLRYELTKAQSAYATAPTTVTPYPQSSVAATTVPSE